MKNNDYAKNFEIFNSTKKIQRKSILVLILMVLISFFKINAQTEEINSVSLQNCKAELSVENGSSSRAVNINNAISFSLLLVNTSSSSQTFTLTTEQLKQDCSNQYAKRKPNIGNVYLNITLNFNNSNKVKNNKVTLSSGETLKFYVSVSVPKDTQFDNWSCIAVKAQSTLCSSIFEETVLSAFVSDPNVTP